MRISLTEKNEPLFSSEEFNETCLTLLHLFPNLHSLFPAAHLGSQ